MSRRSTGNVPELVEKARSGDARSVARLISLVEDASPLPDGVAATLRERATRCRDSRSSRAAMCSAVKGDPTIPTLTASTPRSMSASVASAWM